MIQGESPRIVFDLVMTRFDKSYNPTIIYDAACRVKELALNREPGRFSKIRILSDPLHIDNHTTCSESFNSILYKDLQPQNKEACEQFNSILRSVQSSVTFMSLDSYLTAMKIFICFFNMRGLDK